MHPPWPHSITHCSRIEGFLNSNVVTLDIVQAASEGLGPSCQCVGSIRVLRGSGASPVRVNRYVAPPVEPDRVITHSFRTFPDDLAVMDRSRIDISPAVHLPTCPPGVPQAAEKCPRLPTPMLASRGEGSLGKTVEQHSL